MENFVQPITKKKLTKIKNQAKQENREFENGPIHNDVTWIKKYKNTKKLESHIRYNFHLIAKQQKI